jgi:hypothetical protein
MVADRRSRSAVPGAARRLTLPRAALSFLEMSCDERGARMRFRVWSLAVLALAVGWFEATPAQERVAPRMGGVLRVALNPEPPSLDLQWGTALATRQIGWHTPAGKHVHVEPRLAIPRAGSAR